MAEDKLPTCSTIAECSAHDGKRVQIVGVYTLHNVMPGRPLDRDTAPVRITLDDGPGPFIGAYWHRDAIRPQDERARLDGRRVRVTGTFLRQMPPNPDPRAASLGGPCVHLVERVDAD